MTADFNIILNVMEKKRRPSKTGLRAQDMVGPLKASMNARSFDDILRHQQISDAGARDFKEYLNKSAARQLSEGEIQKLYPQKRIAALLTEATSLPKNAHTGTFHEHQCMDD